MRYALDFGEGRNVVVNFGEEANVYRLLVTWFQSPLRMLSTVTAEVKKNELSLVRGTPVKEDPQTHHRELGLMGMCLMAVSPALESSNISIGELQNFMIKNEKRATLFEGDIHCTADNREGSVRMQCQILIGQKMRVEATSEDLPLPIALAAAVTAAGILLTHTSEMDSDK